MKNLRFDIMEFIGWATFFAAILFLVALFANKI